MPTLDVAINALRAKHGAKQFDDAAAKIKRAGKGVDRAVDKTEKKLGFLGDKYKTVAKAALGMAVTYGAVRFFRASIKEMANYELELANISTMLDTTSMKFMPRYEKGLSSLAIKYGEATSTLSKGLYDILSASIDAADALDVLDVAARAAKAGLTDTGRAADILTTIINAYGMSAKDAEKISDILFATVKRGKTTFDELASSMGMVVSLAATSGLVIEEVSAALATMTRAGISTDMAVTSLKGILTSFLSPTKQNITAAKELGLELNTNTLRTIGLTGAVQKLRGATAEQIAAVFTNVRALTGLSALLTGTEGYMKDLRETTDAAGKTLEAFGKVSDTTVMKLAQASEAWKELKRVIGEQAKPAVDDFAVGLRGLTPILSDSIRGIDNFIDRAIEAHARYFLAIKKIELVFARIDITGVLDDKAIKREIKTLEQIANGLYGLAEIQESLEAGAAKYRREMEDFNFSSVSSTGVDAFDQLAASVSNVGKEVKKVVLPSEDLVGALEKIIGATAKIEQEIADVGRTDIDKQLDQFRKLGEAITKPTEIIAYIDALDELRQKLVELEKVKGREKEEKDAAKRRKEEARELAERKEKEAEEAEAAKEEAIRYIDDQANAYRRLYDDLDQQSTDSYNNRLLLLDKEKEKYGTFINDKVLLDQWYAQRKTELDREAAITSNDFFAGFSATVDQMGEEMITWGQIGQSVAQTMKSSFADALIEMTSQGGNWRDAMRGFALDLLRTFQRMLAQMIAMQMIAMAFGVPAGGGGQGSAVNIAGSSTVNPMAVFGAPTGGKKGLVFRNGDLTSFGKGTVVNRPTIFPMANGMGLMAEKEPEAVMPLTRDESGRLGVRAEGGGATNIIKIFNIVDESQFEDYLSSGNGERVVMNVVKRNQNPGEVSY